MSDVGSDRLRNTQGFLTKNAKEIFWDLKFLSEVTGCRKTQVSDRTDSTVFLILGAVVAVIVWWLDLQLPVQPVPITTKVISSNPIHGEEYSIQHYVIKFVSDLGQVSGFLRVLWFPPSTKLTATT